MRTRAAMAAAVVLALMTGVATWALSTTSPPARRAGSAGATAARPPQKQDLFFVPLVPCRVADTRVAGGPIAAGTARSFSITGTTGFPTQGGHTGGCGIPAAASGISANVTVVSPAAAGYLIGYPAGTTAPLANFATYQQSVNATSNPVLQIASGTAPQLSIRTSATTQLIIDVTGYYEPQIEAYEQGGALSTGTSRVLGVTHPATGSYVFTVDTNVNTCSAVATTNTGAGVITRADTTGSTVTVTVTDTSGNPADANVNVVVNC